MNPSSEFRIYRRALGLAPPYFAQLEGKEVVKNDELLSLVRHRPHIPWSTRVHVAMAKLLNYCRASPTDSPVRQVLFAPGSLTRPFQASQSSSAVLQACPRPQNQSICMLRPSKSIDLDAPGIKIHGFSCPRHQHPLISCARHQNP